MDGSEETCNRYAKATNCYLLRKIALFSYSSLLPPPPLNVCNKLMCCEETEMIAALGVVVVVDGAAVKFCTTTRNPKLFIDH